MKNVAQNFKIFLKSSFPKFASFLEKKTVGKRKKVKKQKNFETHAHEVFQLFFQAMHESKVPFWLACGTLLGAVREKGFIKGDYDMDIGVFDDTDFDHLDEVLNKYGFKKKRRIDIYSKNGFTGFEMTYGQKDVTIDFFVFHREDENHIYMCDFSDTISFDKYKLHQFVRKIVVPFEGLMDFDFLEYKVFIPKNYQTYIAAHYGEDFMTPKPGWGAWDSPALQIVEGAVGLEVRE